MGNTLLTVLGLVVLASAAPYAPYPFPNGTIAAPTAASSGLADSTGVASLASTAPYPFPNGTATASYASGSSGYVGPTGVASLTPTAYPNTMSTNITAPSATMMLKPRSTDSICSKPGKLICSMDGKQAGLCGFTGDESLQWMDVGEGNTCLCKRGLCTIVDVVTYE